MAERDEGAAPGGRPGSGGGFGPYEPLRALTDAGLQGVRDASQIFGGFVSMLDGNPPGRTDDRPGEAGTAGTGPGGPGPGGGFPLTEARALIARLGDVYLNVVLQTFEATFDAFAARARHQGQQVGGGNDAGAGTGTVELRAAPGGAIEGDIFVHNHDPEPAGPFTLTVTDLVSAAGGRVPACDLRLEPSPLAGVDGGASARVGVHGRAPAPGVYHGLILVRELPEGSLPVRLVVDQP